MNEFLEEHYHKIIKMSSAICKCDKDTAAELAHYAIEQFITHKRAEELISKKQGMLFLSGIIYRSYHSVTSPYHKLYRQSGRVVELYDTTANRLEDTEYNIEQDLVIESIQGILEDMLSDTVEQWYRATLFNMWLDIPNYSKISRLTNIPRTSISQAVQECKDYIKKRTDNGSNP